MVDVTRRASLLWPGRKSRHPPRSSLGSHTALKSQESIDAVPLEDIAASPTHSPTHSTNENPSDNPFANPSESLSPFADSQQQTAMMSPSLNPPPSTALRETAPESTISHYRPVLPVSSSSISRPPPPKPLDLPPPRTPPPPVAAPLQAILAPAASRTGPEEDIKETRWWHDWLCGCGEGPDRGGDNQVENFTYPILLSALKMCEMTFRQVGQIRSSRRVLLHFFECMFIDAMLCITLCKPCVTSTYIFLGHCHYISLFYVFEWSR